MCKYSEKLLEEKFPHLLKEQKLDHKFLQVLITESRLETQNPSELITIKEEVFDDLVEELNNETEIVNSNQVKTSNVTSDLSSGEEFIPAKIPTIRKKREPVKKNITGVKKRYKYDKRLYPCHLCGKPYDKWRLEIHLNSHNSKYIQKNDCMLN